MLEMHRNKVLGQIDVYFNKAKTILENRWEQLKQEYIDIELKENNRISKGISKFKQLLNASVNIENDIRLKISQLDMDQHYILNKNSVDTLDKACERILNDINTKVTYFNNNSFVYPTFCSLDSDIEFIKSFGKVINNSTNELPIVAFNTVNFDMQEFNYLKGSFESLKINDAFNIKDKMPAHFRSKVISWEKVIIVGGVNQKTLISSNKVFLINNGDLTQLNNLLKTGREYHELCFDKQSSALYVIGGYNETLGILSSWEKICLKTLKITQIDPMIHERLSWSSTIIDSSFIYVFNGVGNK